MTYDVVIIGAGAAGSVLASRLAANPKTCWAFGAGKLGAQLLEAVCSRPVQRADRLPVDVDRARRHRNLLCDLRCRALAGANRCNLARDHCLDHSLRNSRTASSGERLK
jgi:choline dehydrogenase-like flavoprotein